jgi:hypothetical protein
MKRVLRFAAVNILGLALLAAGTPLSAAPQDGDGRWQRNDDRNAGRVYVAPNYYANGYAYPAGGYYYSDGHAGRTAAIIGGSAAAGALIGAAAGHGEGAAIGAVVGGVAGVIASQAVNHHDHY